MDIGQGAQRLVSSQTVWQCGIAGQVFFDVRIPTGGDTFTVNVGQYWAYDEKDPFTNRHAASMRTLFDLSDLEKSRFIYQTGQSGLVFSTRYRDMSQDWAKVEYRPLQMKPAVVAHQLTLKP